MSTVEPHSYDSIRSIRNGTDNTTSNGTRPIDGNEDSFDVRGLFIFLSFLGIVIITVNGLVFFLVYRKRTLVRKTNFFLISLAVADLLSGAVGIPLVIACSTTVDYATCISMDIFNKFLAVSTILHLMSATIERYVKVMAPFRYRSFVTEQRVLLILAGIWIFSLTAPLIELSWPEHMERITTIYSMVLLCCFVVLPFLFMNFVSIHIFYIIRKQARRLKILLNRKLALRKEKRKQAERRAIVVYSVMSLSFAVGWFPYFYLAYVSDLTQSYVDIPPWLNSFLLVLKFSTALVDPLLYAFFKTDFQAAMKSLVFSRKETLSGTNMQLMNLQTIPQRVSSDESPSSQKDDI